MPSLCPEGFPSSPKSLPLRTWDSQPVECSSMFWHVPDPSLWEMHRLLERDGSAWLFSEKRGTQPRKLKWYTAAIQQVARGSVGSWWSCFQFFCFSDSTSSYGILTVTRHCTSSKDSSTEVQPSNSTLAFKILLNYMLCFLLHWMVMTSFTDPIYAAFTIQSSPFLPTITSYKLALKKKNNWDETLLT